MAILITGGLGFIGAHTARAVLDLGHTCVVTARDNLRVPAFLAGHERFHVEPVDVADRAALLAVGDRHPVDGIVHLAAAKPGVDTAADEIGANVVLLTNVLAAAGRWGVGRVTAASTVGVYIGATRDGALHEDDPLPMTGRFGIEASKKCYEIIGTAAAAAGGLDVVLARIGAIWGPLGHPESMFFPTAAMVHAAVRGERVDLTRFHADDGIDMLYAPDCGRALALLHTAPALRHRVYNVGSGRATSYAEVAAALPDAKADLSPGRGPHGTFFLDAGRLAADTGFTPEYSVQEAVTNYVAWLHSGHER